MSKTATPAPEPKPCPCGEHANWGACIRSKNINLGPLR